LFKEGIPFKKGEEERKGEKSKFFAAAINNLTNKIKEEIKVRSGNEF
jgi:hypothetical protein